MAKAPKPPATLGKAGKLLWQRIVADVDPGWELDAADLQNLEGACRAHDRVTELEAAIQRDGATVSGSRGQTVVHPAIGEARLQRQLSASLMGRVELKAPVRSQRRDRADNTRTRPTAAA